MSGKVVQIPDALYERLQASVRSRGLGSIEQLLEYWQANDDLLRDRRDAVLRIDSIRARLRDAYGEMTDSTEWIREDRER